MEVQLRTLGLPTLLVNGVVTLSRDHTVCSEGDKLTPNQAQLLKHFFIQMAEFKIQGKGYWTADEWALLETETGTDMEM
jgi:mRNA turnover protein 4